ncbi:MAG: nucleotidyl transferase AbiEii/AbiGii toxin family protein [Bacillota bacterium]|nr:nucleotidyl transferase AbiEii/AbiGii toxin family protein [Bacillota bacterium]
MERFLERISQLPYSEKFILKGGLLIASLVGLDLRSTMDNDSTVKGLPLNLEVAELIVQEIMKSPVGGAVSYVIVIITQIMGEHDYPGTRFALQGSFDGIRQAIRIDLSTVMTRCFSIQAGISAACTTYRYLEFCSPAGAPNGRQDGHLPDMPHLAAFACLTCMAGFLEAGALKSAI